jgi:hypothetical protein
VVVFDSPATLNGAGGRESPARTALTLVLDRGHSVVISPVKNGKKKVSVMIDQKKNSTHPLLQPTSPWWPEHQQR